jgi:translation initiation factor 2 subunit 2
MDYDEQLDRAMAESPDIEGSASRFEIPDPEVRQEGNVTVYENFQATLDRLDRDQNHVMKFVQNELGTSATIDEAGRLRLTGDFKQRRVSEAVDAYARAFVICSECGLPDTKLTTEKGATVLSCDACGALSSTGD